MHDLIPWNDWNEHLSMIEYAHVTLVSSSSKLLPFFVDTGRQPKNSLNLGDGATQVSWSRVEYTSRFVQHRQKVIEQARKNLLEAQAAHKRFCYKRRSENPFKVGDLALLSTQNLNRTRPQKRLCPHATSFRHSSARTLSWSFKATARC